jgi:hypothetical protein
MAEKQFIDFCEEQLENVNVATARYAGLITLLRKEKL